MRSALSAAGYRTTLFSSESEAVRSEDSVTRKSVQESLVGSDVLLYHHATYAREALTLCQTRQYRRIIRYHNVTPHEFYIDHSDWHVEQAKKGRELTRRIIDYGCDLWLPASNFSRQELIQSGVPTTSCLTLPPLHAVERLLSSPPDPRLRAVLDDGRRNILSVGRLAPHKKPSRDSARICRVPKAGNPPLPPHPGGQRRFVFGLLAARHFRLHRRARSEGICAAGRLFDRRFK